MQAARPPHPAETKSDQHTAAINDGRPAWLWQGAPQPLGREALQRDLAAAAQSQTALHLYGPAGRGKATLIAQVAQGHIAGGGRVLWLEVGEKPLVALLCRLARSFPNDPRAQALLKCGQPQESIEPLARCLIERRPLLVLAEVADYASIASLVGKIAGALPLLSYGERSLGATWPGEERALPPLSAAVATKILRQAGGSGESWQLAPIKAALKGEALALTLCGRAIHAGDESLAAWGAALQESSGSPMERAFRASFPQLTPAAQGLLLLLAFGPAGGQRCTRLQQSSGATSDELAELRAELRGRGWLREWGPAESADLLSAPPAAIRPLLRELAKSAGTAAELRARTRESRREQLRLALTDGPDRWVDIPDLLSEDSAYEEDEQSDWRELAPFWEGAATELEARGYAYELAELRQRAGSSAEEGEESTPPMLIPFWAEEEPALIEDEAAAIESAINFPDEAPVTPEEKERIDAILVDDWAPKRTSAPVAAKSETESDTLIAVESEPIAAVNVEEEAHLPTPTSFAAPESDPAAELRHRHRLGATQLEQGDIAAAIRSLTKALTIAEDGDVDARRAGAGTRADILYQLGCAQLEDGNLAAAQVSLKRAQEEYETNDDPAGAADALGALGSALGEQGRWSEAADAHRSAVAATRVAEDRAEEALQLSALAYAYFRSQQLGAAVRSYRQALYLTYEAADAPGIARAAAELAEVLMNSPRHLAISQLLLEEAIEKGAPVQDIAELRAALEKALASAEASGVTQAPVRGDAYTFARQAYEAQNARQKTGSVG